MGNATPQFCTKSISPLYNFLVLFIQSSQVDSMLFLCFHGLFGSEDYIFVCSHFSIKNSKNSLENYFLTTLLCRHQQKESTCRCWQDCTPFSTEKDVFWVS